MYAYMHRVIYIHICVCIHTHASSCVVAIFNFTVLNLVGHIATVYFRCTSVRTNLSPAQQKVVL